MKLNIYAIKDPDLLNSEKRKTVSEKIKKYVIEREFQIADVSITLGENGKPEVLGSNDIHFNLSHSGEIVICAACPFPLGVDVERHGRVNELLRKIIVLENFEKSDKMFFDSWTMREAWIKAKGESISKGALIKAPVDANTENELFYSSEDVTGANIYIDSGYSCAYCMMAKETVHAEIIFIKDIDLLI